MALGTSLPAPIGAGSGPARYVDGIGGNDANDGLTLATAWKTIGKACTDLASSPAGKTVYVRGGIYRENVRATIVALPTNPVTITNYPGEQVIWQALSAVLNGDQAADSATINVDSTTGWPTTGNRVFAAYNKDNEPTLEVISYTGTTSNSFTGCTGGTTGKTLGGGFRIAQKASTGVAHFPLTLVDCAYVRIVGSDVGLQKGIVFDGYYVRSVGDNNAVVYFSGTTGTATNHCLMEGCEIKNGHDHGCLTDTGTHDCQILRNYFHDGGSPPVYGPVAVFNAVAGTGGSPGLGAATYYYRVFIKYESGNIGTDDTTPTGDWVQVSAVVSGGNNKVTLTWPATFTRNQGYRIWRGTASGTFTAFIDVAQGTTSFVDQGQSFTSGTYNSGGQSNKNRDHAQYLEGTNHLFANNLIVWWDFGHVIQIYPTADGSIVCNNTIVHGYYSAGTNTGWHSAQIVVGSDSGLTNASNAVIVNNIIAYGAQGVYGYTNLGQVTSLNGGITLPNDTTTTFTVTVNSAAGFEADGQIAIGGFAGTQMSLVRYSSISGNQLLNCTCIGHGLGLTWANATQVRSNVTGLTGGANNVAHHNLFYSNTFTDERDDPSSNGTVPIVDFLTGNKRGLDPKFTSDANRDYHLLGDSPAIGYGVDAYTPTVDFEGNPRSQTDAGAFANPARGRISGKTPLFAGSGKR
jgi:hypothetical protein